MYLQRRQSEGVRVRRYAISRTRLRLLSKMQRCLCPRRGYETCIDDHSLEEGLFMHSPFIRMGDNHFDFGRHVEPDVCAGGVFEIRLSVLEDIAEEVGIDYIERNIGWEGCVNYLIVSTRPRTNTAPITEKAYVWVQHRAERAPHWGGDKA